MTHNTKFFLLVHSFLLFSSTVFLGVIKNEDGQTSPTTSKEPGKRNGCFVIYGLGEEVNTARNTPIAPSNTQLAQPLLCVTTDNTLNGPGTGDTSPKTSRPIPRKSHVTVHDNASAYTHVPYAVALMASIPYNPQPLLDLPGANTPLVQPLLRTTINNTINGPGTGDTSPKTSRPIPRKSHVTVHDNLEASTYVSYTAALMAILPYNPQPLPDWQVAE